MNDQDPARSSVLHRASYDRAASWLRRTHPSVAGGFLFNLAERERVLEPRAREVFAAFARKQELEAPAESEPLEAVVRLSVDFLRLQGRFLRTGRYARTADDPAVAALYQSAEIMDGYYLDGLLLTYAFWPNHVALFDFFVRDFVASLPDGVRVLEIGTGHGLMAARLLCDVAGSKYVGLDLSPFALRYAAALLRAHGIPDDRVELRLVPPNGTVGLAAERGLFDVGLCCEVLEHVKEPQLLLHLLRESLRPGGRGFVTTVANIEAEDHVYLYDDADHIRRELDAAGFTVERELVQPLRGLETARPQPLNYAAVVVKKGTDA